MLTVLRDDIRVAVLMELWEDKSLSIRAFSRRLKCNYSRIEKALRELEKEGLIVSLVVNVSGSRKYKFYSLNEKTLVILKRTWEKAKASGDKKP